MLGGRTAREEGGRARPEGESRREDFARARLARGHRLPRKRPACRPTSTSSVSKPSATAARPASATPARSHPAHRRSDRQERSRRGQRALRQPQLRSPRAPEHQGELPHVAAARRGLRPRRHASISTSAPNRSAQDKDGKPVYLKRHLADAGGDPRRHGSPRSSRKSSASSTRILPSRIRSGTRFPPRTGEVYEWDRREHLHPGAAVLRRTFGMEPGDIDRDSRRASAGHLRRLRHHRPHQPRRAPSRRPARPASSWWRMACRSKISTAMAPGVATTAS